MWSPPNKLFINEVVIALKGNLSPYQAHEGLLDQFPLVHDKNAKFVIDMSKLERIWPFPALVLANRLKFLVQQGHELEFIPPENKKVKKFLQGMNFFGFIFNSVRRNEFYIDGERAKFHKISEINRNIADFADGVDPLEDVNQMIGALGVGEEFTQAITMAVLEMCDNAFRHSQAKIPASIFIFRYEDWLDIAIVDTGIGIKQTYINHQTEDVDTNLNDGMIIWKYATKGKTSDKTTGRGMGLRKTKRLVETNRGNLVIHSGKGLYRNAKGNEGIRNVDHWQGTAIGIRLKANKPVMPESLTPTIVDKTALKLIEDLQLGF